MHLISICGSVSLSLSLYSSVWPACYLSLSASTCLSLSVCLCLCIRIRACLLRGSGEVGCMVQPSFFQCFPWMTDRLRPRSPSPIYSKLISIKMKTIYPIRLMVSLASDRRVTGNEEWGKDWKDFKRGWQWSLRRTGGLGGGGRRRSACIEDEERGKRKRKKEIYMRKKRRKRRTAGRR